MKKLKYHLFLFNDNLRLTQRNQGGIIKRVFINLLDKPIDSVEISYGKEKITLQIPNDRYKFIKPLALTGIIGSENIKTTLINALERPVNSKPLEFLIKNKKITYLVEDSTRSEAHKELIEASFSKFQEAKLLLEAMKLRAMVI